MSIARIFFWIEVKLACDISFRYTTSWFSIFIHYKMIITVTSQMLPSVTIQRYDNIINCFLHGVCYLPDLFVFVWCIFVHILHFSKYFAFSQFSSVQSLSPVRLFATPWIAARQASLSITNSWSLLKLMSIELVELCFNLKLIKCLSHCFIFFGFKKLCFHSFLPPSLSLPFFPPPLPFLLPFFFSAFLPPSLLPSPPTFH